MTDLLKPIVSILILTILVEGVVENLGTWIPTAWKPYAAAAFAILVCIGYSADLPGALGLVAIHPLVGSVFTGLIIGRGSNYVNDLVSRLKVVGAPAQPVGEVLQGETMSTFAPAYPPTAGLPTTTTVPQKRDLTGGK